MSLLFNRVATLKIGVLGQEGKDLTGLRINFSIEKNSESNPNQAKIQVFNLSASSRAFAEQDKLVLVLLAGYAPYGIEPITEILCTGDVKKVTNELKGPDWVTTFEMGDGEIALQEKTFDKTFEKGVSLSKVIGEVKESFGLAAGAISGLVDKVYSSGLTLSGGSKQLMDVLTKEAGVEWSVQDGEIQVLPPTGSTSNTAIFISPQSGLLNSPIKREKKGVELSCLLIAGLRPGRQIQIQSSSVNGLYRIRKVTFSGDTVEGDWTAKIEAI